jgi:hypothetical protein
MLFRKTIAVYNGNRAKHINTLCGKYAEILNVEAGGIYDYHFALNQWFPNFCGPPPPWFHIHTHSAPLPFLKNISALLFPLLFYI